MHNVYYKSTFDGRDYTSEFLELLKVSFVSCLYKLILKPHVSLEAPDPLHADYSDNVYE